MEVEARNLKAGVEEGRDTIVSDRCTLVDR